MARAAPNAAPLFAALGDETRLRLVQVSRRISQELGEATLRATNAPPVKLLPNGSVGGTSTVLPSPLISVGASAEA